jgi:hypothetical protein
MLVRIMIEASKIQTAYRQNLMKLSVYFDESDVHISHYNALTFNDRRRLQD